MSIERLNDALSAAMPGTHAEAEGRIAILTRGGAVSLDVASRRRIVAMAREHGFSNVALELTPDANLPGDQPVR